MTRMELDEAFAPPPPIDNWPGVGHQPTQWIAWRQEFLIAKLDAATDPATVHDLLAQIMPAILPGRTWDEIQDVLDAEMMRGLLTQCSRAYHRAQKELAASGNAVAGTAPASPPPTPETPSSPASPVLTAAPCGAS